MGIRLDWEIEADKKSVKRDGEDPESAHRRRMARLRVLVLVLCVVMVILGIATFMRWRVNMVSDQIEQALRDVVIAEVTALRVGDKEAFLSFQRSAAPYWVSDQDALFDNYQQLIQQNDSVQLTGRVLEVEIDNMRARVHVEEIINNTPYARVWFYWRYEDDDDRDGLQDGWRHVPVDPTFWGVAMVYNGQFVTVNYDSVDSKLGSTVGQTIDEWVEMACSIMDCDELPPVRVEIVSQGAITVDWLPDDPWVLRIPSPYLDRNRCDMPFTPQLQIEVATLLAERMVIYASNNVRATYPADAYYLQQATISWLVGRFVQIDTGSFLVGSMAAIYGNAAVGQLLSVMSPDSNIAVISQVIGVTLDQSQLDWRDFLTWRLEMERDLIMRQDSVNFYALYDTSDDGVLDAANARFGQEAFVPMLVTLVQAHTLSADGAPQTAATVRVGEGENVAEMQILFRLIDNVWLRAG